MKLGPIRYFSARGNHYEVGRAIGKKQRGAIRSLFGQTKIPSALHRAAERALPRHKERLPHYVSELSGMAEGAGVNFMDLFTYNCFEYSCSPRPHNERCTTLFWKDNTNTFIGHNEESYSASYGQLILVRAYIKGNAPFLSFNYPGVLCGDSIAANGNGMIQALDALYPRRPNPSGFARSFIARALLEAKTLAEAQKILKALPSMGGMHFLLYSRRERKGMSIETYANRMAVTKLGNAFVHTNHYAHMNVPHAATKRSHFRVKRVRELFDELQKPSSENIRRILTDHRNNPYGLCKHPAGPAASATLAQVLVDIKDGTFSVTNGIPCSHRSKNYSLSF